MEAELHSRDTIQSTVHVLCEYTDVLKYFSFKHFRTISKHSLVGSSRVWSKHARSSSILASLASN